MTSETVLASGRGVSARIDNISFVCVYAPAGGARKAERATFFSEDITPLVAAAGSHLVIGGDFNAVTSPQDTTGMFNKCLPLNLLVDQLRLSDVWPTLRSDRGHTFLTATMSSRLDRLYVGQPLKDLLVAVNTVPVSFSDHLAVVSSLSLPPEGSTATRPPSAWTLDAAILQDEEFEELFSREWRHCCSQKDRFPSPVDWWLRAAKPFIRRCAANYTRQKRHDQRSKLAFLQDALQELCAKQQRSADDMLLIKEIKTAMNEVHAERLSGVAVRSKLDSLMDCEPTTMHHVIRVNRRSRQQDIRRLKTDDGEVLDTQDVISDHLLHVYRDKFSLPPGPPPPPAAVQHLETTLTAQDNQDLAQPITEAELLAAIKTSKKNKSPGTDGITAEFYKAMAPIIKDQVLEVLNDMLSRRHIPEEMLCGIIVFVEKHNKAVRVKDYRPLTLLNTDTKLFTRVLAARLTPLLDKLLHPCQVRPGGVRNMPASLMDLRDVISYLNATGQPGSVPHRVIRV